MSSIFNYALVLAPLWLVMAVNSQEPPLEAMAKSYVEFGMPLPPAKARLVQYSNRGISIVNGKEIQQPKRVAFLVGEDNSSLSLLVGPFAKRVSKDGVDWKVVSSSQVQAATAEVASFALGTFELNARLAFVLQLENRGEKQLARDFFKGCLDSDFGNRFSQFHQPRGVAPEKAVAYLAWAWVANELLRPESSRRKLAQVTRKIFSHLPEVDSKPSREWLSALEAAETPSHAKSGTILALIDALTDAGDTRRTEQGDDIPDAKVMAVVARGFDAVPALLEHLSDTRLTRSVTQGFNNFPPWHNRVGQIVGDILQDLAGQQFESNWLDRQHGNFVKKASAAAWWASARAVGEREYLRKHALQSDSQWPNQTIIRVLGLKYPEELIPLVRELVETKTNLFGWPLIEALAKSDRPAEEKRVGFLLAARRGNDDTRRAAMHQLVHAAPTAFKAMILEQLKTLGPTPTGPYWSSPEAGVAHLVLLTDDPSVWEAFLNAAKRADIGLRMELMNPLNYSYVENRLLKQRLVFLSNFLDDVSLRDTASAPEKFEGPHAGFVFPKLRVCDLASEKLGSLLEVSGEPKPSWTVKDWDEYRSRVRVRLNQKLKGL